MKIFISGTAGFGSGKTLRELPNDVKALIDTYIKDEAEILVGDCIGVDLLVQKYLVANNYKNVTVYHSGTAYRNLIDFDWKTYSVKVPYGVKGREFFAAKDKRMALDADAGLALWDGKSVGTGRNIANMREMNKIVTVYRIDKNVFEEM